MTQSIINDATYWRSFEENKVTHSVAHYLMAIDQLHSDLGYARVTDVAGRLGISRGAASIALTQLKERGLVSEDPNRFLLLTEEGRRLARSVEHNFVLLACFFENILGVSSDAARADACKMEHLLSEESSEALVRFLQVIFSNRKWVKELIAQVNVHGAYCTKDGSCPLCEPLGECLMPPDAIEECPLSQSIYNASVNSVRRDIKK